MQEHRESRVDPVLGPAAARDVDRRGLIRGAAVAGIALPLAAACGPDGGESGSGSRTQSGAGSLNGSDASGGPGGAGEGDAGGTSVAASDVPVGGGTVLAAEKIVVTQPSKGQFKAFSGVCTHQGCIVQTVTDGKITCPCHGSAFSVKDGSVVNGPATQPLEPLSASVEGDQVTVS